MYKIDKDVPVPTTKRPCKYPWADMGISKEVDGELIGDSFLAPGVKLTTLSSGAASYGRAHNMKFLCRTVDGGVRVWRIA